MSEIADKAKTKAWNNFKAWYPNADLSKFSAQVSFDYKGQSTAAVYFSQSDEIQTSVSRADRRYWDGDMNKTLWIGGFPLELTLRLWPGTKMANFIKQALTRLDNLLVAIYTAVLLSLETCLY